MIGKRARKRNKKRYLWCTRISRFARFIGAMDGGKLLWDLTGLTPFGIYARFRWGRGS